MEPERVMEIISILLKDRTENAQQDREAGCAVERLESISERTGISPEELREAQVEIENLGNTLRMFSG
ncbi:MAG: hypothetical protein Q8P08_01615 [bacterium]|nr:hypothetical protein [bacterium]